MGSLFLYWSSRWPPDLKSLNILSVQEKEPRYVCQTSHLHKTWVEVSSNRYTPCICGAIGHTHSVKISSQVVRSNTEAKKKKKIPDCALFKDNSLVFTVGLRLQLGCSPTVNRLRFCIGIVVCRIPAATRYLFKASLLAFWPTKFAIQSGPGKNVSRSIWLGCKVVTHCIKCRS